MRLINLGGGLFINANQVVSINYKLGSEVCGTQAQEAEHRESWLEVFLADGRSMQLSGEQADRLYSSLVGVVARGE